jgi:hypothetical protein
MDGKLNVLSAFEIMVVRKKLKIRFRTPSVFPDID